jgi:hypothetical protein
MPDNVSITAGSGTTIRTDDVGGVQYQVVKIDVGADGVSAPLSTSNPVPISDAGGSLTVDGTVAVTGTFWQATQPVSAASLPLPTGAATSANQSTANTSLDSIDTKIDALTTPSDTQPISAASLPLPLGAATAAKQPALGTAGTASADVLSVQGIASMTPLLVDGSGVTQPVSGTVTANLAAGTNNIGDVDVLSLPALPAGNNNIGDVDVASLPALPTGANTIGAVTQNGTWTVQPGNTANTTPWLVKETRSGTATTSNVSGSASNVTLLASNTDRLGATIYNDSSAVLYLKLGATASATSFTVLLLGNGSGAGGYFEVPAHYTGIIDGIWASATGAARVTELT